MGIDTLFFVFLLSLNGCSIDNVKTENTLFLKHELVSYRTENMKIFDLGNNMFEAQYFSFPIHYFDNENFVKYDNEFSLIEETYVTTKHDYKTKVYSDKMFNKVECCYDDEFSFTILSDCKFSNEFNINAIENYIFSDNFYAYDTSKGLNFANKLDSSYNEVVIELNNLFLSEINNRYYLVDNNNFPIYKINEPYLTDSNESKIHPDSFCIYLEDNNKLRISTNYNVDILRNLETSYSLNNNLFFEYLINNESITIKDKYIINNTSYVYDNNHLLVGKDPLMIADDNGNLIDTYYKSIVYSELPDLFSSDRVVSATLNITEQNPKDNVNIYLKEITSDILYESINGKTSYTTNSIASGDAMLDSYSFDVTNNIKNNINNETFDIMFEISGSSQGYSTFYSTNYSNSDSLYLSIVFFQDVGDAFPYNEILNMDSTWNCFGYALNVHSWIDFSSTQQRELVNRGESEIASYVLNIIKNATHNNDYIIDSYYSGLQPGYRRVAFKFWYKKNFLGVITRFDFHFIKQDSDGNWSGKLGNGLTYKCTTYLTPESDDVSIWGYEKDSSLIYSKVFYFAIQ